MNPMLEQTMFNQCVPSQYQTADDLKAYGLEAPDAQSSNTVQNMSDSDISRIADAVIAKLNATTQQQQQQPEQQQQQPEQQQQQPEQQQQQPEQQQEPQQ